MRKGHGLFLFIAAIALALGTGVIALASPSGTYGCTQLEALWVEAGGSPGDAVTAAAIARAESAGKVTASNSNTNGTTDYGLWQINSVNGGSIASYVPIVSAEQAVSLHSKYGWSPWVTYQHGAQAGLC